jgi:hypothetical protein
MPVKEDSPVLHGPEVQIPCPQIHAPDFSFDGQLAYAPMVEKGS